MTKGDEKQNPAAEYMRVALCEESRLEPHHHPCLNYCTTPQLTSDCQRFVSKNKRLLIQNTKQSVYVSYVTALAFRSSNLQVHGQGNARFQIHVLFRTVAKCVHGFFC